MLTIQTRSKMKNILTAFTILIANLKGTPYGLNYDIYENYYDYELSDNNVDIDNPVSLPHFITQPLNMIVNSGKTAKLPCLVDRLEGFVLLWKKNEQIISVGHQLLDMYNTKYQIEPVKNGNFLLISSVDLSDEDNYSCAVSTVKKEQVTHNLRVRLMPEIETSPSEVVMVEEGDPVYLQCNILAGSPIPSIRWRRCGGEVLTENQMYSIKNIKREEAGCYSCEADNGFSSTPVSQEVTVIVQYAPEVTLQKLGDSSDNVTLICNVESQPGADVVIYRDKTPLFTSSDNETDVHVTHDTGHDLTVYTLHLHHLDISQFGDYICSADNILGSDRKTVKVSGWPTVSSVKISPDPSQSSCYSVTVQLQSDSPVQTVQFLFSGNMGSYNISPSHNTATHRQCNLDFSSQYSVLISAANNYGFSPRLEYNFTTEEQRLVNLAWSGASFLSTRGSVCQIMLILQLVSVMIPRLL